VSFDTLAPHYRWMEFISAGEKLQRCRVAFLNRIRDARNVLIIGEGNGRFLVECRHTLPNAAITCVDSSPAMLDRTKIRLLRHGENLNGIRFIRADIQQWTPPAAAYDAIVTHFFLDCFRADQLERIIPALAQSARPGARWLLADFREPERGWSRIRASLILCALYGFFRMTTSLPARQLTPPEPFLQRAGFSLDARKEWEWGLLHSDCWRR
jgi:ubiquinone/menaquinone biosynthesis C-methylase UbiE